MVTENVTIKISQLGAAATAAGITRVGVASVKAAAAVGTLLVALGGFLAVRGIAQVGKDSIKAAASFEQFEIRISALLGSQKEATIALRNFTDLASRTPFAVAQIVEGASALGAAALGNREALERLTLTAANLAATTGISFNESANNLQRALSAGIGAADLFRDRGVRALIESILGIPDATKLSTQELGDAFDQVFGEFGVFGDQAEALANTLGGSLSNIGDAATNLRVAIGDAFAPAVIATARQALIPFLVQLRDLVVENEEDLREMAATVIRFVIVSFINLARAGATVVVSFKQVGNFARLLIGTYKEMTLGVAELLLKLVELGAAAGLVGPNVLAIARGAVQGLRDEVALFAQRTAEAQAENEKFERGLDALNEKAAALERALENLEFGEGGPTRADVELPDTTGDTKQTEAQIAALKKVEMITNRLRVSSAARVSQEEAQLERLIQQRKELVAAAVAAAVAAGDETLARNGLLEIEAQIADIRETQREKLEEGILTGQDVADRVGETIGSRIGEGIRGAFLGEGLDAMNLLANIGGDLVEQSLNDAVSAISESVSEIFSNLGGEFSGAFGSAIAGAVGVGIGILARELAGGSATARNDLVQSAVQSTQATRGVVAGPTSIPVFQVGQQLNAALADTNSILDRILAAILTSPSEGSTSGAAPAGSASSDLALATPSLV